jgi:hypothetical protein
VGAQEDAITWVLTEINQGRIANGLPPYLINEQLSVSAQGHSQDMAAHNLSGQIGSDNSSAQERIAAAGYPAYSTGVVGDELVYRGPEASPDWWIGATENRDLVLSTRYREIGIGYSLGADGQAYWVLDFGAQPNILPIFADYGAPQTEAPTVTLTLSNEGAMVYGDGPEVIGLANDVRVSNDPSFAGADWQAWFAEGEWSLTTGEGVKSVYVEFRDQEGRRTISRADIVRVAPSSTLTLSPTPSTEPPAVQPTVTQPSSDLPSVRPTAGQERPSPLPIVTSSPRPLPFTRWLVFQAEDVLPFACGLQLLASLLGFIIAARRQRLDSDHTTGENGNDSKRTDH